MGVQPPADGRGVALPTIWLSKETIAVAALLVGGTFMVITMLGLQEARARSPDNPTTILGRMTAAFATGQLAGPLLPAPSTSCRSATLRP